MSNQVITEVENLLHEAAVKLGNIGHGFSGKVHALLAELRGDEQTLQHDAEQDGVQLVKDADAAMGPIVAEAEKDASSLGSAAVTDIEQAVTPVAAVIPDMHEATAGGAAPSDVPKPSA